MHKMGKAACCALSASHGTMKTFFDRKSVKRDIQVGDNVLVVLPNTSSALQAKICGSYVIEKKLGETKYVVAIPNCRTFVLCHFLQ